MSPIAIVMMLLFMAAIWGGLVVSYVMLSRADQSGRIDAAAADPDGSDRS